MCYWGITMPFKNHPTQESSLPTLETGRLILRPFDLSDAERVRTLAGDPKIAATTQNVPHPYQEGMAETWIASHPALFESGEAVNLAVVLKVTGELIGAIGFVACKRHRRAELGYWIGVPFWGQGYCTEAAKAVIQYGFEGLGYHKINSCHIAGNPASGRVMEKSGLTREGVLVDEVFKDGAFHTVMTYGIIRVAESVCH
ncbi:Protein N-acetyltransferase, RimJ/RimL family [Prosthecobacter debontii]|uniref:Protein N-acetyltransferase, RimJ/RimL family n=2 Tax=Prosthecobacter debontii TaxID=48467 RepID=A0A1T4XTY0_9BACT|nr:Protein N-acetyltransferase, RimJ/RimL family [Prosthecobacter debontii]